MPKSKKHNKNNRSKRGYEAIPSPTQNTTYNSINTSHVNTHTHIYILK